MRAAARVALIVLLVGRDERTCSQISVRANSASCDLQGNAAVESINKRRKPENLNAQGTFRYGYSGQLGASEKKPELRETIR